MAERTLDAAVIGSSVPPGSYPVAVHSVFRSAINLRPLDGDRLITLLDREATDQPRGVRLDTTGDLRALGLEPGAPGTFREDGILLDGGRIRVSFAGATRLPRAPLPPVGAPGPAWHGAVALLAALQDEAGADLCIRCLVSGEAPAGALAAQLTRGALDLGEAIRAGDGGAARGGTARMVGLGGGLTPSGDDFLCGLLSAAHCRPCPVLEALREGVRERLGSTNAISATFLACSAEGEACGALRDLAGALGKGAPFQSALVRLCTLGHSSGMDLATGFLYGLALGGAEGIFS